MKRFVLFASVVVSSMWMLRGAPQDLTQVPEWPKQTKCEGLSALPFKTANNPTSMTFKLYVGRIMTLPYTPVEDPNAPANLCSPLSYVVDSCKGMEIVVNIKEDGTKIVKTAAYNEITKNAVCYSQSFQLQEDYYHIFKGLVDKMAIIDDQGVSTELPTIPGAVTTLQDTLVTTLGYGENLTYAIYASCLKNAVWVAYSEQAIKDNLIDGLKKEIDDKLTKLGFDPETFVDVPTSIPINVDNCFVEATV